MKPLVSCILATGTRRDLLGQALRCFARQSYEPRELIVVDDGPQSAEDLIPWDGRIRHVRLDRFTTLGSKLNTGIRQAQGQIIQKMDDDDYYHPEFLVHTVSALDGQDPDCAVAAFDRFLVLVVSTGELKFSGSGWFAGGTLCFDRRFWHKAPFRDDVHGRCDWHFLQDHDAQPVPIREPELYILVRHDIDHLWTEMGGEDVTAYFRRLPNYSKALVDLLPAEDAAFYARLRVRVENRARPGGTDRASG